MFGPPTGPNWTTAHAHSGAAVRDDNRALAAAGPGCGNQSRRDPYLAMT